MLSLLGRDGTVIASSGGLSRGEPEEIGALAQRHRNVIAKSAGSVPGWLRLSFDDLVLLSIEVGEGVICIAFVERTASSAVIRRAIEANLPALAEAVSG